MDSHGLYRPGPVAVWRQTVHTWHHLAMWAMVIFVIVHIYAAVREDIMSRQSIISSMISGWRNFRDAKPIDRDT
jgi:Ni/Fe-hydrogenase 1 B-type cytochrome subunit